MENVKNSPVNIKFVTKTLDIVLFFSRAFQTVFAETFYLVKRLHHLSHICLGYSHFTPTSLM